MNFEYKDINLFNGIKKKSENDINNKKREDIIKCIVNKDIQECFYEQKDNEYYKEWNEIKNNLTTTINEEILNNNISKENIESIKLESKGGRNFNYDFNLVVKEKNKDEIIIKFEFKYGCKKINDTPQFYSPSKPSNYLDKNFEKYVFEKCIPKIIDKYNEIISSMINKKEYKKLEHRTNFIEYEKEISTNKAKKDTHTYYLKKLYDTNKKFNEFCKKNNKETIKNFISEANLNIEKLTNQLVETQKEKIYLLCDHKGNFKIDSTSNDTHILTKVVNKTHNTFICETKNNKFINVLLRWKNGNGILFPAFQIKENKTEFKKQNKCITV